MQPIYASSSDFKICQIRQKGYRICEQAVSFFSSLFPKYKRHPKLKFLQILYICLFQIFKMVEV